MEEKIDKYSHAKGLYDASDIIRREINYMKPSLEKIQIMNLATKLSLMATAEMQEVNAERSKEIDKILEEL